MDLRPLRSLLARLASETADDLESDTLECKSWHPDRRESSIRELRETAVSFANAGGGVILLGVADRVRGRAAAIQGVGDLAAADVRRKIYDGTEPHVLVEVQELIEPEGRVLAIRVPHGMPPHTTTDGVGKIRIGRESKPLTGSELARLFMLGGQRDLTAETLSGSTIDDLDPALLQQLQAALRAQRPALAPLAAAALLEQLALVQEGRLTLAAVLLAGRPSVVERWAPQQEIIVLRYGKATSYLARHDLRGPILPMLVAVEQLLAAQVAVGTVQASLFREITLPDLGAYTAREAVLNAIVHRNYFLQQSITIELRPGSIEVTSPGGFPAGVTPANLLRHPPVRRNPLLARALQEAGYVNRAGLGVDRIYEELLRLGKAAPVYEADEASVRLRLFTAANRPLAALISEETLAGRELGLDALILLRALVELGEVDRWGAAERLQLSDTEAAQQLKELFARGWLAMRGRGRAVNYRLIPPLAARLQALTAAPDRPLPPHELRRRVTAALKAKGSLTNADVRRLTGLARLDAVRLMGQMRAQKTVRLRGIGRGAHYVARTPAKS